MLREVLRDGEIGASWSEGASSGWGVVDEENIVMARYKTDEEESTSSFSRLMTKGT